METVNTDTKNLGLRELAEGFIRFSVKADDTEENQKVHEAFKNFCRIETDNNYTQGLRKLLEYYQGDFKYEMLHSRIESQDATLLDLKGSIIELSKSKKVPVQEDEDTGAF